MKTPIFSISALLFLHSTAFLSKVHQPLQTNLTEVQELACTVSIENSEYQYIKTVSINGELIPVVDLPELTIQADYPEQLKVKASFVNGEIRPVVDLPELTVEG